MRDLKRIYGVESEKIAMQNQESMMDIWTKAQLAVCKEHSRSEGQCNCVQHHVNRHAERTETLQLSHLYHGEDERAWFISGKESYAGDFSLVRQPSGELLQHT